MNKFEIIVTFAKWSWTLLNSSMSFLLLFIQNMMLCRSNSMIIRNSVKVQNKRSHSNFRFMFSTLHYAKIKSLLRPRNGLTHNLYKQPTEWPLIKFNRKVHIESISKTLFYRYFWNIILNFFMNIDILNQWYFELKHETRRILKPVLLPFCEESIKHHKNTGNKAEFEPTELMNAPSDISN